MRKMIVFIICTTLFAGINACKSVSYYNYESDNTIYTELQLYKDGTFKEYVYYSMEDSAETEGFGNILEGTYTKKEDTLLLSYHKPVAQSSEQDVYVKRADELVKLEPITFSHHFLNMVFKKGKSTSLRKVPNYETINWNDEF